MVLVPATMELLGEANWWLPRWLDAVLPRISTERGTSSEQPVDRERVEVAAMAGR
jgi:RND superfamily putative drug exporter